MIDPLEAVLTYLAGQETLAEVIGEQIAAKHKFAMGEDDTGEWTTPSQALQLRIVSGGEPDLYGGTLRVRLEARCYGADQVEAMAVMRALLAVVDETEKCVVTLSEGDKALLYSLAPEYASPEFGIDPDVRVDAALCYLRALVAAKSVP